MRSARRLVAATSDGSRQPDDRSPEISDSPIRPAPRIAILRGSTMRGVYGAAGASDTVSQGVSTAF